MKAEEFATGALDLLCCLDISRQSLDTTYTYGDSSGSNSGSGGVTDAGSDGAHNAASAREMGVREKDVWPPTRDLYCEEVVASFVRSAMNKGRHGSFRQYSALLLVLVLRCQRKLRGVRAYLCGHVYTSVFYLMHVFLLLALTSLTSPPSLSRLYTHHR